MATAAATLLAMTATGAAAQSGNQFGDSNSSSTSSGSSGSGEPLITASSIDLIIAALERYGYRVELTTDSGGDPLIRSTSSDDTLSVYFYGCRDGKDCTYVNFVKGWDTEDGVTLNAIEEWNRTKVWGKAYRDDEKDPWLIMPVNLYGGVSVTNFDDTVDWWKVIVKQFQEHIDW